MNTAPFRLQTETYCDIGYSKNIGVLLKEKEFRRAVLLADEGVAKTSAYYDEIQHLLRAALEDVHVRILRGTEEPDYDYLDDVANDIRAFPKPDVIIGIGGGSCLDIMKAVAVLRTNQGKGIDYRGFDKIQHPGIPTLAIPTTAGTGSEATINAVFTDKREMKKLGINGRFMNATYAILDAEWTMSCPHNVAVSSGMDALVHCLESFMCRQHTMITRVYSREAFRLLYMNLPAIAEDPENRIKRQALLLGSYLAGIALFNSGSGIAGAFSYPLGVHFKIPHGIAGGIFISSVVQYNVDRGYTDYAELLDLVEFRSDLDVNDKNRLFSEKIHSLTERLGVPVDLQSWGITAENVEEVAKLMLPLQAAFDQNPVPFSAGKDALDILVGHVISL